MQGPIDYIRAKGERNYQRRSTGGFPLAELLACQAIDPPQEEQIWKENNLANELCPVFASVLYFHIAEVLINADL